MLIMSCIRAVLLWRKADCNISSVSACHLQWITNSVHIESKVMSASNSETRQAWNQWARLIACAARATLKGSNGAACGGLKASRNWRQWAVRNGERNQHNVDREGAMKLRQPRKISLYIKCGEHRKYLINNSGTASKRNINRHLK